MTERQRFNPIVEKDPRFTHLWRVYLMDTQGSASREYAASSEREAKSIAERESKWLNR